jgi:histidinol-phosphatase
MCRLGRVAGADLDFALELAGLADSLSLPRFRAADLRIETKPDLSPVTDADRAVERALRERIAAERPGESVFGEEEGDDGGAVRWIVDPIDGTRNFTRGLPVGATLIALERDGVVVCGVVSAPALGHRWWAARGEGAWRDGEQIHVSGVASLEDAAVSCTHADDLARFEQQVWHARGLGDFWQHVLVAEGALDAAVDARLALWDYAAVAIVVEEAGGRSGAPDGGGARPDEQLVSTNGVVHDAVLELLRRG